MNESWGKRSKVAAQGTVVVAVMLRTVDGNFSKDYDKPKTNPAEVGTVALQAVLIAS